MKLTIQMEKHGYDVHLVEHCSQRLSRRDLRAGGLPAVMSKS